jgi:ADP-ribose pyrophosphatase
MSRKDHDFEDVSSELEYENPYMAIFKHAVVHPDKSVKPYWVLSRKGNFSVVIPLFPDNSTILVSQYRFPLKKYTLEFPMGKVEGSTTPLKTAKQELSEETGFTAQKWHDIGRFFLAPGFSDQQASVFVAESLKAGKSHPEDDEYLEVKRVKIEEVGRMIHTGRIADGPTILAYYFYQINFKKSL